MTTPPASKPPKEAALNRRDSEAAISHRPGGPGIGR